jgi:DNA-binding Lrp family transcriptional regulator
MKKATAYIFLKLESTEPEINEKFLEKLRKRKEVKEAYMVYGIYDVIAKIETETPVKFYDVIRKIKSYNEVNQNIFLKLVISD